MRRVSGKGILQCLLLCLCAAACVAREGDILRVQDGSVVSFEEMTTDLASVPLVFFGEIHSDPDHHRAQLEVIRALADRGRNVAVGLEMFHDGHQKELDRWLAGEMGLEDFLRVYYHNWNLPWGLYRDIFLFAREEGLPMIGLNASPDLTKQVAAHGFDSLTPEQLEQLPGASCKVDAAYEEFIRRALGEHAHGKGSFRFFCEAQMVWDTTMAKRVVDYLEENEGTTMIVLAGSGHSWKRGIPQQVRRLGEIPFRTVLPGTGDRPSRENVLPGDTDYLWLDL
jgi:uncharacterized iron-regulated protein